MTTFNHKMFHEAIRVAVSQQMARLGKDDFPEHDLAKDYPILGGAIVMSILWTLHSLALHKDLSPTDLQQAIDAALSKLDEIGVEQSTTPMGAVIFQWKEPRGNAH